MSLYDGNQLPENPTSNFQLLVSMMYTLLMAFLLSLGGFAAWATSRRLRRSTNAQAEEGCECNSIGQSLNPTEYMHDLVQKRNAIVRGLLAFIPAVYSLAHLYANSLHSSANYSTGNIFFSALIAYSALYMGKTLQQLVADSDHMDTTKAVYESLYMLASTFDRLRLHPRPAASTPSGGRSIFADVEDAMPTPDTGRGSTPTWRSPWVLFNVFLAIGAQDDARTWPTFSCWLGRFQLSSFMVFVPSRDSLWAEVLNLCILPAWIRAMLYGKHHHNNDADDLQAKGIRQFVQAGDDEYRVGYAYWLYSQDKSIRTITGSMLVSDGVADEMALAGCRSGKLYYTAEAYMSALSKYVASSLSPASGPAAAAAGPDARDGMGPIPLLTFVTRYVQQVDAYTPTL